MCDLRPQGPSLPEFLNVVYYNTVITDNQGNAKAYPGGGRLYRSPGQNNLLSAPVYFLESLTYILEPHNSKNGVNLEHRS